MLFSNKIYLFLLFLVPILVIAYFFTNKLKNARLKLFSNIFMSKNLVPKNYKDTQIIKFILQILALVFFIFAVAGPKFGTKMIENKREGIEIFIAVDTSLSMLAEDIKPNRISRAKTELMRIASSLETNKIGLIAFAGTSILQCPLTLDMNAVALFFESINVGVVQDEGTNIQSVIELAEKHFDDKSKTNKVLVILSDGEDANFDDKILASAKEHNIKIFTIGFGSKTGEVIPMKDEHGNLTDYLKDENGNVVNTKLDDDLLKKIADKTGGKYYYSQSGYLNIDEIIRDINSLDKQKLSSKMMEQYEDRFYYFLAIGLLILIIEMFMFY